VAITPSALRNGPASNPPVVKETPPWTMEAMLAMTTAAASGHMAHFAAVWMAP
jgi:hypothetical protein